MGEIKAQEEPPLQPKRKPDAEPLDCPKKSLKLEPSGDHNSDVNAPAANSKGAGDSGDQDAEKLNGEAMADKGKGILRDDKGKGKLIVEEEEEEEDDDDDDDDSDDDSSGGGSELEDGGDSDLSDDPLAEVDLDNILPSRTRRRHAQPGVYIASDGDDSDDSDA